MFVIALLMAAAAPSESILTDDAVQQLTMVARSREADAAGRAGMLKRQELEVALRGALTGRTRAVSIPGHGIYVVYNSADGKLYAWFPGQPSVVSGTWGVQKLSRKVSVACQRFDRPGATPRTGPYLPQECMPAEKTLGDLDVLESWDGDPFLLSSGQLPFIKQPMGLPRP
ncbi:hypothetical protein [Sphingomonas jaspsi]|uniref:hypothetical protein n=1 Tax=Sphingomonas jaspsi TaxID=392409 RepID=UPI0004B26B62|nr:hypothetical protein [Sphingomonas jaspsi]